MKGIKSTILLILLAVVSQAQGIHFEESLNWQQLKQKAKSENKFIFVDCYATWCGPCKLMDQKVYPEEKVGSAMNDKFLSVKIQFDETTKDSEAVKQWRETARSLSREYKIAGFPTFLFFSPDGKLVYQALGAKDPNAFISMTKYALTDPVTKFRNQLADYRSGIRDYRQMPGLIQMTRESGDQKLADTLVKEYKTAYLDRINVDSLSKENIRFLISNYNLTTSNDNFFSLMYRNPSRVDSAWYYPIAKAIVSSIVTKEELETKLWKDDQPVTLNPNWPELAEAIGKKYDKIDAKTIVSAYQPGFYSKVINSMLWKGGKSVTNNPDWRKIEEEIAGGYHKAAAQSLVADARLNFYKKTGNWKEFARLKEQKIKDNPPRPMPSHPDIQQRASWQLNVDAWDVFEACPDKAVLQRALSWSELSIRLAREEDPNEEPFQHMDTKANLLYKLGRVKEAIALEEKLLEMSTNGGKNEPNPQFKANLEKMKKAEVTWKVK